MTQKQFTKFAEGIISGLTTMQDLRNNKPSLFESYPILAENDNWDNLVIYARNKGLTPVCNHIRVTRNKAQFLNILTNRGYKSMGEVKYLRPIINQYIKDNKVDYDYKGILQSWKEFVTTLADNDYSQALSDYTYSNIIKEVSKLVFDNPKYKEVVVTAVGANILKIDNPLQFVKDWYSYTDLQGNLLVAVNYINEDNTIIATKWEFKQLTTKVAISVWENALNNVKRCFRAGRLGKKYTPLKRAEQGSLTGNYWEVVKDDKGRYIKGNKIGNTPEGVIFSTTLADRNKEVQE